MYHTGAKWDSNSLPQASGHSQKSKYKSASSNLSSPPVTCSFTTGQTTVFVFWLSSDLKAPRDPQMHRHQFSIRSRCVIVNRMTPHRGNPWWRIRTGRARNQLWYSGTFALWQTKRDPFCRVLQLMERICDRRVFHFSTCWSSLFAEGIRQKSRSAPRERNRRVPLLGPSCQGPFGLWFWANLLLSCRVAFSWIRTCFVEWDAMTRGTTFGSRRWAL